MCYFLYASLFGDVDESAYAAIRDKHGFKISRGTKHDVKLAVKAASEIVQDDFRVTDWICDCDSPVGRHDPDDPTIRELCDLIRELLSLDGARQICICKTWAGRQNKKETVQKLKDTDLPTFLAEIKENHLYCMDF